MLLLWCAPKQPKERFQIRKRRTQFIKRPSAAVFGHLFPVVRVKRITPKCDGFEDRRLSRIVGSKKEVDLTKSRQREIFKVTDVLNSQAAKWGHVPQSPCFLSPLCAANAVSARVERGCPKDRGEVQHLPNSFSRLKLAVAFPVGQGTLSTLSFFDHWHTPPPCQQSCGKVSGIVE